MNNRLKKLLIWRLLNENFRALSVKYKKFVSMIKLTRWEIWPLPSCQDPRSTSKWRRLHLSRPRVFKFLKKLVIVFKQSAHFFPQVLSSVIFNFFFTPISPSMFIMIYCSVRCNDWLILFYASPEFHCRCQVPNHNSMIIRYIITSLRWFIPFS